MGALEFNQIYNMDCVEGMQDLPERSVDLVVTDPPFAIDFKAHRSNYNRTQSLCRGTAPAYDEMEGCCNWRPLRPATQA